MQKFRKAGTRVGGREKCITAHKTCQDSEGTEVPTRQFHMVRSTIFYFHSMKSIITAKLKTGCSQISTIHEYK